MSSLTHMLAFLQYGLAPAFSYTVHPLTAFLFTILFDTETSYLSIVLVESMCSIYTVELHNLLWDNVLIQIRAL